MSGNLFKTLLGNSKRSRKKLLYKRKMISTYQTEGSRFYPRDYCILKRKKPREEMVQWEDIHFMYFHCLFC